MLNMLVAALAATLSGPIDGATEVRVEAACAHERTAPVASGEILLAYRDLGPSTGRPVLLLGGTDQQLVQWPGPLLKAMQDQGLRPILYDARDVGCSTHMTPAGPPNWTEIFAAMAAGQSPSLPYDLATLATDAVELLDHLGLERADLLGVSGGATVAAEIAAAHPERVGRLVLVMANSGNPALPMPAAPARLATLPPPPPPGADTPTVNAYRSQAWMTMDGAEPAATAEAYRAMAAETTARSWDPDGIARAGAALLVGGDRRSRLADVSAPTLVVHGEDDPLISRSAGEEVAESIPGAVFIPVPAMGHSLTQGAVDHIMEFLAGEPESDLDVD